MRRLVFVLPLLLARSVQAADFSVDTTVDAVDASPGDGICGDATGACTLRAAVMETNALGGADVVMLPAGTYFVDIAGNLDVTDELRIPGAGAVQTVVKMTGQNNGIRAQLGARLGITNLAIVQERSFSAALVAGPGSEVEVTGSAITGAIGGSGAMRIVQSTIDASNAYIGFVFEGTGTVINSTISGGDVRDGGKNGCLGAILILLLEGSSLSLVDSTLAFDDIDLGCWGWWTGIVGSGSLTLSGTIVESSCESGSLSITSNGHNLDSDDTCNLTDPTDLHTDALLGPLQDNGGPTATHALLPGSPAIDAIPPQDCTWDDDGDPGTPPVPLATDQRGIARPQGAGCDIGAFEAVPEPKERAGWAAAFAALMLVRHIRGRSARSAAG
jgi:hypothetical protein